MVNILAKEEVFNAWTNSMSLYGGLFKAIMEEQGLEKALKLHAKQFEPTGNMWGEQLKQALGDKDPDMKVLSSILEPGYESFGLSAEFEVDPTVFLAPFFALFFAFCLTDAGYGLVIIALMVFLIKKIRGDKKLMWMLGICSAFTVVAGALTGGWFGNAVDQFFPVLKPLKERMMWFDPLQKPMNFFKLAIFLGYIQIMTGLLIAFGHNLKQKNIIAALCDQLTWLVMLNSIVIFLAGKGGFVPPEIGKYFGFLAIIPAAVILLFSQRQGSWAARIGMGAYNLFSAIFYMGDVLSYLRLMALGMVTAGLAMAINIIADISLDIPWGLGIVAMIIVLSLGHGFNLALSGLSAFVHTLRLQYVEFFPKFFVGGGRLFQPLAKQYKHIYIKREQ